MIKFSLTAIALFACTYMYSQRQEKTADYADEIRIQLKALEDESISKLRPHERDDAYKRIDKIYFYLDKMSNKDESRRDRRDKHKENVIFPMDDASFNSLQSTMDNEFTADDRIRIVRLSAASNYFTMDQLIELIKKFTFDDNRMQIIELVYPKLINTENSHLLFNYVSFISSKNRLEEIIKNGEQNKNTNKN